MWVEYTVPSKQSVRNVKRDQILLLLVVVVVVGVLLFFQLFFFFGRGGVFVCLFVVQNRRGLFSTNLVSELRKTGEYCRLQCFWCRFLENVPNVYSIYRKDISARLKTMRVELGSIKGKNCPVKLPKTKHVK